MMPVDKSVICTNAFALDNIDNVLSTPSVNEDEKIYDFADILSSSDEYSLSRLWTEAYRIGGKNMIGYEKRIPYS